MSNSGCVLIVDDDASVRDMIAEYLGSNGYEVMQADSGLMFANQTPAGEPRRIGLLMADIATALYAVQAASAALYRDGLGFAFKQMGDYFYIDGFEGAKHFGVWPLQMAAQSCYGRDDWPADVPVPQATIEYELADVAAVQAAVEGAVAHGDAHPVFAIPAQEGVADNEPVRRIRHVVPLGIKALHERPLAIALDLRVARVIVPARTIEKCARRSG